MKFLLLIISSISFSFCFAQQKEIKLPKSASYAGKYSVGKDIEKGPTGFLTIYPDSDSSILFYLNLNRGAPSYNMGEIYGRVKLTKSKGIYNSNPDSLERGCMFSVEFKRDTVIIKTLEDRDECGYGFGVYSDGIYRRYSRSIPSYFINNEGKKIYFKKVKLE